MKKGKVFMDLLADISKTASEAKALPELKDLGENLDGVLGKFGQTAMHLGKIAASSKALEAFAHATPFGDIAGDVVVAWMLLWRAVTAQSKLSEIMGNVDDEKKSQKIEKNKGTAFYDGQIKTARYFINSMLPVTLGRMDAVMTNESAPVDITDIAFGG
ncbi:MAG: acyl-CoA dehydrogenase C-terminal domain-containing protein [Desulfosarcina sp.]|nr:acyl-CoA dehydrogenase C-terminal domain-containing protein [Desulfobacterales bacterium]